MNNVSGRVRTRLVVVVTTITIAASLTVVPTRARAVESVAEQRVQGIGGQQPGLAYERPAALNQDLGAMQAAGMTWVRADFFWSSIQSRGPGSWYWGPTDAFVKAAKAHHLHVVGMLAYAPRWARSGPDEHDPPKNPNDYANFARAAARRYAPMGVHTWEIWNEPNLAVFWAPRADPVAYAALLRRAYPAIKSADRNATVISGGLAPARDRGNDLSPMSFIVALYYHGAKGNFDGLGLHPYSYPYAPMKKASWNVFYNTPTVHKLMADVGDGNKKIWGTEIGYPTGTSSKAVSEQTQANDLVAAITAWQKWSFTGPMFIFQLRDSSTKKSDLVDNMGILRWSGQAKPAYNAIRNKLR
ncbi:MAG TPA: cellulase family glycosylhydrolase [Acidimicrobiia bacterium]|nr:cellulase family glycosylhydrolase [Acidimicrobiia bacterium]